MAMLRVPRAVWPSSRRLYSSGTGVDLASLGSGSVTLHLPKSNTSTPGIAYIIFRNVKKRNAISGSMMVDLSKAVDELSRVADRMDRRDAGLPAIDGKGFGDAADEIVSCVILAGEGSTWCAGFDLSSDREKILSSDFARTMSTTMHSSLLKLRSLPMLSVASLSGFALGGGAELSTAADFRVWSPSTKLRFVQLKMAVVPGWGGATRLANLVGERTALRMLSSTETVDAKRALELGLADHVAEPTSSSATLDSDQDISIDVEGMESDVTLKAATRWVLDSFIYRDPPPKPEPADSLVGPEDFSEQELAERRKKAAFAAPAPPRARNSPLALRSMKRAIWTPEKLALEKKGYERELEQFVLNWGSHYNIEAVNALRKMV